MDKIKERIKKEIEMPTKSKLKREVNNFGLWRLLSYYLITKIDENLFSFLSGATTSFAVAILLELANFKIEHSCQSYLTFIVRIFIAVCGTMMSIEIVKFTLLHIKIKNQVSKEENIEKYKNMIAESFIECSSKITKAMIKFVVCLLLLLALLILNFVFVNL